MTRQERWDRDYVAALKARRDELGPRLAAAVARLEAALDQRYGQTAAEE